MKRYGQRVEAGSDRAILEGWETAHLRYGRYHKHPDRNTLRWLQLRRNAHKRAVYFNPSLTPEYLGVLITAKCPVTGIKMTTGTGRDTDCSIDRVINHFGYTPGNCVAMSVRANRAKGSKGSHEIRMRAQSGRSSCGLDTDSWRALRYIVEIAEEACQGRRRQYLRGENYVAGLPYSLSAEVQAAITTVAAIDHPTTNSIHPMGMLMAMLYDNSRRVSSRKKCFTLAKYICKCGTIGNDQANWMYWSKPKSLQLFVDYWESLLPGDREKIGAYLSRLIAAERVATTPSRKEYQKTCKTEN